MTHRIHKAAACGDVEGVRAALSAGVDVNIRDNYVCCVVLRYVDVHDVCVHAKWSEMTSMLCLFADIFIPLFWIGN
jgi:hypothetical protein